VLSYESVSAGSNDASTGVAPTLPESSTTGRSSTETEANGAAVCWRAVVTRSSNARTSKVPAVLAVGPLNVCRGETGKVRFQPVVSLTTASSRIVPWTSSGASVASR
jgi:hypothetical protein